MSDSSLSEALSAVPPIDAIRDYLDAIEDVRAEHERARTKPGSWSTVPTVDMLTKQDVLRLLAGRPTQLSGGAEFRVRYWSRLEHAPIAQRTPPQRSAAPPDYLVQDALVTVVREFPAGGPEHERAIRRAFNLGWEARQSAGEHR